MIENGGEVGVENLI